MELIYETVLLEVLNKPYPFEYRIKDGDYKYTFNTEESTKGYVAIFREEGYTTFIYNFSFFNLDSKGGSGIYNLTGTGDQYRVMATVLHIGYDFIRKGRFKEIKYTVADEDPKIFKSRKSLYTTLTKLTEKKFPYLKFDSDYITGTDRTGGFQLLTVTITNPSFDIKSISQ